MSANGLFLPSAEALFPDAQLWVARTTPFTVKKGHLPVTGTLGDEPPQEWADDLIQIHPIVKGRPLRNALLELAGVASPDGGVALDIRLSFTNRNLARRSLAKLLSWNFDKLIIAHGACLEKGAKTFVERAFRWLAR